VIPIIQIRGVVKVFGSITAVAGVDLDIDRGECFGLLGPNGAGKTSLVRMIVGVSPISQGSIVIDGKDIVREPRIIKADLGVVPQEDNLDPDLSVVENLTTFARYFDIPGGEARQRAMDNLRLFELQDRQKAKIEELSGGMKRRLLIARALTNRPKLLVLDEPTVGLDPQTKHLVWRRLRTLKAQGTTLLLCTQNMDEASFLCDRLAVMNEGRIVALGTPPELIAKRGGSQVIEVRVRSAERKAWVLSRMSERGLQWQEMEEAIYVFQRDGQALGDDLASELLVVNQHVPTLEDVFLKLTGRSLKEP
jgi:lipooligosaccharide transport system ATP-binding protein